eukprot:Sspe_Gene.2231::Locus_739_Transcript_1_2_Confidence_0.667_Length_1441::g.2231::m.2231
MDQMGAMMGEMGLGQPGEGMGAADEEYPLREGEGEAPDGGSVATLKRFKSKMWMKQSLVPVGVTGEYYYDLPKSRCRTEWDGGFEIERWDLLKKVRVTTAAEGEPEVEVEDLDPEDTMAVWEPPPAGLYVGRQQVGEVDCYVYDFDLFGMVKGRMHVHIPEEEGGEEGEGEEEEGGRAPSLPVFQNVEMRSMVQLKVHLTEHEAVEEFDDALFDVSDYLPPPPPPPENRVAGYTKDATTNRALGGVEVVFEHTESGTRYEATSGADGTFSLMLPSGEFTATYSREGYSTLSRPVAVTGRVGPGTVADGCLSPELAEGEGRVVLRWGAVPRDLDLYAFDEATGERLVYYRKRSGGGARLNVDVQSGYGPETITMADAERAYVIKVHKYSRDSSLAASGAVLDCYQGDGSIVPVALPAEDERAASSRWWVAVRVQGGVAETINEFE